VSKPVVLVVDDDPQVLAAVRRDIRSRYRETYTVMGAGSGQEALATVRELKARADALALVVSDQRMPGMLGVELLAQSREIYPMAKRALLTAYSDIDAAVRAINEAHLDHYLSKPWDPPEEHLYPVLDELLDEWQVMRPRERAGLRLVGHQWSPRSHAVKDFLASNLIHYEWLEATRDEGARTLLDAGGVDATDLPALFLESGEVLRNPSVLDIAKSLGLATTAARELYDLAIVGAGPAGLAAAVYASSEGLRTLLLDRHSAGGQAGTSSRIENYLGFPSGVSGSELTRRAVAQAVRLGAEFITPVEVVSVAIEGGYKKLQLSDGREIVARAMIATTGMVYREHPAHGVTDHAGAGVYYGAASTEAAACAGKRVLVIGGGNSAGQAAMHLSRYASEVHIAVRRDGLADTMSQYLIDQLAMTPNVRLRPFTEMESVEGTDRLERVVLKSVRDSSTSVEDMQAVFVFIGTRPHSDWLPAGVLRDAKGFVVTGREALACDGFAREWKEEREPLPLETSAPGVFAAGDLRAGAMNRVASAVGEGAMAVRLVHEYLALT
jgi:thioredoxin reductase (NADPH)